MVGSATGAPTSSTRPRQGITIAGQRPGEPDLVLPAHVGASRRHPVADQPTGTDADPAARAATFDARTPEHQRHQ